MGNTVIDGKFGTMTWALDKFSGRLPFYFAGTVRTDAPNAAPGIGFDSYDEQGPILRWDIDGDGFTGTGPRWKFIATKGYFAKIGVVWFIIEGSGASREAAQA